MWKNGCGCHVLVKRSAYNVACSADLAFDKYDYCATRLDYCNRDQLGNINVAMLVGQHKWEMLQMDTDL